MCTLIYLLVCLLAARWQINHGPVPVHCLLDGDCCLMLFIVLTLRSDYQIVRFNSPLPTYVFHSCAFIYYISFCMTVNMHPLWKSHRVNAKIKCSLALIILSKKNREMTRLEPGSSIWSPLSVSRWVPQWLDTWTQRTTWLEESC